MLSLLCDSVMLHVSNSLLHVSLHFKAAEGKATRQCKRPFCHTFREAPHNLSSPQFHAAFQHALHTAFQQNSIPLSSRTSASSFRAGILHAMLSQQNSSRFALLRHRHREGPLNRKRFQYNFSVHSFFVWPPPDAMAGIPHSIDVGRLQTLKAAPFCFQVTFASQVTTSM